MVDGGQDFALFQDLQVLVVGLAGMQGDLVDDGVGQADLGDEGVGLVFTGLEAVAEVVQARPDDLGEVDGQELAGVISV